MFIHADWGRGATAPLALRGSWLKTSEALTVLIVDDDALVGEMYRLALGRAGFNALVAKDGPAGLQMAASSSPALIFLDIRMPLMDGIEVLKHLVADEATRRIPIVMLSNYDDGAYIKQCLGLGAKEYLVKVNIRPADLATVASRWINPAA
ncbi:MAG: two-component system, OmpR family, response regulator [Chloroflexota bacterium]|jgi:two-component system cell cycle response regulator DivK|nr:two-component system, OmpR family, response regulator [Chloroflexota bacterium]